MTTRDHAPLGSPCWVDLFSSDTDATRTFYTGLFGWAAEEASEEFGGYFMFTRDGVPVAGAMGPMGDMAATNVWTAYLDSDDLARTLEATTDAGGSVVMGPMSIADLGSMAVLVDPTGASIGVWQAESFPGFTVLDEPGAPSWFELFTREHARAVDFYRTVFGVDVNAVGDSDEFRYSTLLQAGTDVELAGVMDAASFLPEAEPAHWSVYWEVDDTDAALARVVELGGLVEADAIDTPYGRMATALDSTGARFKLRRKPD